LMEPPGTLAACRLDLYLGCRQLEANAACMTGRPATIERTGIRCGRQDRPGRTRPVS
jgi:hypothetical protein